MGCMFMTCVNVILLAVAALFAILMIVFAVLYADLHKKCYATEDQVDDIVNSANDKVINKM